MCEGNVSVSISGGFCSAGKSNGEYSLLRAPSSVLILTELNVQMNFSHLAAYVCVFVGGHTVLSAGGSGFRVCNSSSCLVRMCVELLDQLLVSCTL